MDITSREENGVAIIMLEGEVDISAADLVRGKMKKLIDEKRKRVLVNMADVPYIDSSGLGMFVETMQEIGKYGGEIKLAGLTDDVKKVFELTRLNKFFSIFDQEKDAMESFK